MGDQSWSEVLASVPVLATICFLYWAWVWRTFTGVGYLPARRRSTQAGARCDMCTAPISSGQFCTTCTRTSGLGGYVGEH
jgi:hypothetical protein